MVLEVVLDGFQTGRGRRGTDYIGVCWHVSLPAILSPGFLLAAEVALHPGDGDEGPDAGPGEGEGPAQLLMLVLSYLWFFCAMWDWGRTV
jgi:hypothetical protein